MTEKKPGFAFPASARIELILENWANFATYEKSHGTPEELSIRGWLVTLLAVTHICRQDNFYPLNFGRTYYVIWKKFANPSAKWIVCVFNIVQITNVISDRWPGIYGHMNLPDVMLKNSFSSFGFQLTLRDNKIDAEKRAAAVLSLFQVCVCVPEYSSNLIHDAIGCILLR